MFLKMTLLIAWIGFDCKKDGPKQSSIYIASDSRISWENKKRHFDFGRKVFGCKNSPDIFGYCGDVLFPSIVLSQIIDLADLGILFKPDWDFNAKFNAVVSKLSQSFKNYPSEVAGITDESIEVIHASRNSNGSFQCRKIRWTREWNEWRPDDVEFSGHSDRLFVAGSGKLEFLDSFKKHWNNVNSRTSRAVFHSLCDALDNLTKNLDPYCGGPPQIVGLYRKFDTRFYGIIKDNKRYFCGMEISDLNSFDKLEWRNDKFEICDGFTMRIKEGMKEQPNGLKIEEATPKAPPN